MKIYKPNTQRRADGNDVFCRLNFENNEDRRRFNRQGAFRGQPLDEELCRPYRVVQSFDYPELANGPLGDCLSLELRTDPMTLSRRALDALLPHIGYAGEVVPLIFGDGEYGLFNVTRVIDALAFDLSEVTYYRNDGKLKDIKRHFFKPDFVRDEWIFKIPETPYQAFVTDHFVNLVRQEGLTGFRFELLWCSERGLLPPGLTDWERPSFTGLETEPYDFDAFWERHTANG
jgi:hypothetical protein